MESLRATYRLLLLVGCLIYHIFRVVVPALFRGPDTDHALRISRRWLGWYLKRLGVQLESNGKPPAGAHIFVGNHRSYLDGIIAMSAIRSIPVVKAEVADWPLLGFAARRAGILFVKRESKHSRSAALEAIQRALKLGFSVLVYPEGTTHVAPTTIEFRTGAFNLAAKRGYSIVPMAIDYEHLGDAWVGDETFLPHFMRCFGRKYTHVHIRYGEPILSNDIDFLIDEAKNWIDENMLFIRQAFNSQKTSATVSSFAE